MRAMGAAVLIGAMLAGTAVAADFKVAVVDQQQIMERSKAGKRALDGLKEFSASRQRIVSADDEELKKLEDELKSQESTLSEAQKRDKQEQFRAKFEGYQKRLQDFNREIQGKQKELAEDFLKRIEQATAAVADRGGYSVVMDKGNPNTMRIVIYNSNVIDITDAVIKEFDKQNK
jgi:outer membrane protein